MTSPNAQINIKQRDLLPRISLPDDVSGYIFFRRNIQGWRWHPIRCLSPLHSGPGAPGSRTRQRGHRPSPFACASLSPQHHCCWTRNIATNRLLWPERRTSGDPPAAAAPKRLLLLRLEPFLNRRGNAKRPESFGVFFGTLYIRKPQELWPTMGMIQKQSAGC